MAKLLTFEQTAERLGVTRVTLYRIVDQYNELTPAYEVYYGKQRRRWFYEHEVEALKAKRNPQLTLSLLQPA